MQRILATAFLFFVGCLSAVAAKEHSADYLVALLANAASTPGSYLASNKDHPYFVTAPGRDISSRQIDSLRKTGLTFRPGSQWTPGAGIRLSIGRLILRKDGAYDVSVSYYCGPTCGADVLTVMRRTPQGWQVVSSSVQVISARDTPNKSFKPNPLRGSA